MSVKESRTEEKSVSSHAPNFKVKEIDEHGKEPLLTRKHSDKQTGRRKKNQMPSKKRSGGNGFVLSKEDVYYLKTHTRYDEKEIK